MKTPLHIALFVILPLIHAAAQATGGTTTANFSGRSDQSQVAKSLLNRSGWRLAATNSTHVSGVLTPIFDTQVSKRGPHQKVVKTVRSFSASDGKTSYHTNSYVQLETGMHCLENGAWRESAAEIEAHPGGAIARHTGGTMIITNLLSNMLALALSGEIPTNTPAFQQYAHEVMLTNAQDLGHAWGVGHGLINSNTITGYGAVPYPEGMSATIVFSNRFVFEVSRGGSVRFTDVSFDKTSIFPIASAFPANGTETNGTDLAYAAWSSDIARKQQEGVERWAEARNLLTLRTAQKLAETAMSAYGLPMKDFGKRNPKVKSQLRWKDDYSFFVTNGWIVSVKKPRPRTYRLPYYEFVWETDAARCEVQVSGIISNIVSFHFSCIAAAHKGALKVHRAGVPANYYELLGLSADTVLVRRRSDGTYEDLAIMRR